MRSSSYLEFFGEHHPERPLPVGSVVNNEGMLGKVTYDDGSATIQVNYESKEEEWIWDLCEIALTVVTVNHDHQDVTHLTADEIVDIVARQENRSAAAMKM